MELGDEEGGCAALLAPEFLEVAVGERIVPFRVRERALLPDALHVSAA